MKQLPLYSWMSAGQKKQLMALEQQGAPEDLSHLIGDIQSRDWKAGRKQLYLDYLLQQQDRLLTAEKKGRSRRESGPKRLASWHKSGSFTKLLDQQVTMALEKFRVCGLVSVICATLVLYFFRAWLYDAYVVSFSVDAIFAVIAGVILVRYVQETYRLLQSYGSWKMTALTDGLAVVLCILWDLLPVPFDISLVVLFAAYWSEKKRFERELQQYRTEAAGRTAASA